MTMRLFKLINYLTFLGAKFPFVMKLCFSSSRQIGQGKGQPKKENQGADSNPRQNNGMPDDY